MTTYIKCKACSHKSDIWRRKNLCRYCNNTQLFVEPSEILCNLCGECMCLPESVYPDGLYNAEVSGGYNSYYLSDMTSYEFSLCEKCLREMFIKCKIKPKVDFSFDAERNGSNWDEDYKIYEYKIWRDAGNHHQAYLNGKCNSIKDCQNDAIYTIKHQGEFSEDSSCEDHKNDWGSGCVQYISNVLKTFL